MSTDVKEFALIIPLQSKGEAKKFYAGPLVGTGLAYHFHTIDNKQSNNSVILDVEVDRAGFGNYKPNQDEWEYLVNNVGKTKILSNGKKIRISKTGYIYETARKAITWQFKLDRIAYLKKEDEEDKRKYFPYLPRPLQIMLNLDIKPNMPYGFRAIVLDLKMLKEPISQEDSRAINFKKYGKQKTFFPRKERGNRFVHGDIKINERDLFLPSNAADLIKYRLKHYRVQESLVHECLKILIAEEGWFGNWELKVTDSKRKTGRIDFLIKENEEAPWTIIEVKLDDNPDAIEQIQRYVEGIQKYRGKNKSLVEIVKNPKRIKRVILCHDPKETRKKAKGKNIEVWTYRFIDENRRGLLIGFEVRDSRGKVKLATNW